MKESPTERIDYTEARVDVPVGLADAACDFVTENIASGLVLEEEENGSVVGITFYVPIAKTEESRKLLEDYLSQLVGDEMPAVPCIRERVVRDVDWIDQYKASIKPIRVGGDVLVRPQWHAPQTSAKYDIVIEPKMAFGTGSHETTRRCLEVIRENFRAGMRFLDLGAGSGILSILAAKLGAKYIKAIDYDLAAVENCRENFEANRVATPHDILFGSIDKCHRDERYEFICSNTLKSTILPVLPRLLALTASGGYVTLSGLLEEDETEISEDLRGHGQAEYEVYRDNQWLTYLLHRR